MRRLILFVKWDSLSNLPHSKVGASVSGYSVSFKFQLGEPDDGVVIFIKNQREMAVKISPLRLLCA